jgi:predicted 2-oxoglutarate/Fe(II)-dependent dioxygenase YbiX
MSAPKGAVAKYLVSTWVMHLSVIVPERIFTIEGFFSPEECARAIERGENAGFEAAGVQTRQGRTAMPGLRNNDRAALESQDEAAEMWQRLQPFVPSPLFGRDAIGLSSTLKFYRYDVGQTFKMHADGSVKGEGGQRSLVTFMIYLNHDFIGGHTRFELRAPYHEADVAPRAGMALLFLHTLQHEGAQVLEGRKYVLRSDVMYSALPEAPSST